MKFSQRATRFSQSQRISRNSFAQKCSKLVLNLKATDLATSLSNFVWIHQVLSPGWVKTFLMLQVIMGKNGRRPISWDVASFPYSVIPTKQMYSNHTQTCQVSWFRWDSPDFGLIVPLYCPWGQCPDRGHCQLHPSFWIFKTGMQLTMSSVGTLSPWAVQRDD